ncbi:hypothetical protein GJAV_G00182800 [Gymnothorax javanicus]|nr:hypothetical protein GJAV_G00182800 [Gymnothorax javanicus]
MYSPSLIRGCIIRGMKRRSISEASGRLIGIELFVFNIRKAQWKVLGSGSQFSTCGPLCAKPREIRRKKDLSEKKLTRYFVDQRTVKLVAGSGGKGACTFHSEPRKEWGGPDGGNGGDGGNIVIKVDRQVKSLSLLAPVYRGKDGERGGSKNCFGRNAATTYIQVPVGTVLKEYGKTVTELTHHNQEYVAVYGGAGGKGNRFFLSNENRAPLETSPAEQGQQRVLDLELRTMAHAGMVGFPNAGKSSLLRAISNARPAVAPYPFTTLNPHVGVVRYQDHVQVAVADIPGIIRGAHLNRGLGVAFLRHIERCRCLLFVLDLSAAEPWEQLRALRYELQRYDPDLPRRPHAIVANKLDLPEARQSLAALRSHLTQPVIPVSALTGQNVEELILRLRQLYDGQLSSGHVMELDEETAESAQALWNYLCLRQPLEKSDVILGLGCHDLRVAERAAALYLEGWAPWLLFTGYLGNQTAGVWQHPEALAFLDIALKMGVPRERILLETKATNTGENIRFSYQVLKDNRVPVSRLILVQQPFMERRVLATFLRQWPGDQENTSAIVTSPCMNLAQYPHPSVGSARDLIGYMLGVIEKIRDYPKRGFQLEQEISSEALTAYQWFLSAGYTPK